MPQCRVTGSKKQQSLQKCLQPEAFCVGLTCCWSCVVLLMWRQAYMQQYSQLSSGSSGSSGLEPSAAAGILSERFVCGPPLTSSQLQDPYYTSELGQVRIPWPGLHTPSLDIRHSGQAACLSV